MSDEQHTTKTGEQPVIIEVAGDLINNVISVDMDYNEVETFSNQNIRHFRTISSRGGAALLVRMFQSLSWYENKNAISFDLRNYKPVIIEESPKNELGLNMKVDENCCTFLLHAPITFHLVTRKEKESNTKGKSEGAIYWRQLSNAKSNPVDWSGLWELEKIKDSGPYPLIMDIKKKAEIEEKKAKEDKKEKTGKESKKTFLFSNDPSSTDVYRAKKFRGLEFLSPDQEHTDNPGIDLGPIELVPPRSPAIELRNEKKASQIIKEISSFLKKHPSISETHPNLAILSEVQLPTNYGSIHKRESFRNNKKIWPSFLTTKKSSPKPETIFYQCEDPVAQGELFTELLKEFDEENNKSKLASKTSIIVSAESLRNSEVLISSGLSWEKIAKDTAWSVLHSDRLKDLRKFKHVVVVFRHDGAVVISQNPDLKDSDFEKCELFSESPWLKSESTEWTHKASVIFSPEEFEDSYQERHEHFLFGKLTSVTYCCALWHLLNKRNHQDKLSHNDMVEAVKAGLITMRDVHKRGFEDYTTLGHNREYFEWPYHYAAIRGFKNSIMVYGQEYERSIVEAKKSSTMVEVMELEECQQRWIAWERLNSCLDSQFSDCFVRIRDSKWTLFDDQLDKLWAEKKSTIYRQQTNSSEPEKATQADLLFFQEYQSRFRMAVEIASHVLTTGSELSRKWPRIKHETDENIEEKYDEKESLIPSYWRKVPMACFAGKMIVTDRFELEAIRSIRRLVREYARESHDVPIGVGIFGQPGTGKSFTVQSIYKDLTHGDKLEGMDVVFLEFNLSQMQDERELAERFQEVSDASLRRKLPIVLWDEFDCTRGTTAYGWLKSFLSVLQDGRYFLAGRNQAIGKSIHFFAGGISHSFSELDQIKEEHRDEKVPDFLSRLKGFLDIVGLNSVQTGRRNFSYIIRRALILRDICRRFYEKAIFRGDRLEIDESLAWAFLCVGEYRHGARSLESIVKMSALESQKRFRRSSLPSREQMKMHTDANEFMRLLLQFEVDRALREDVEKKHSEKKPVPDKFSTFKGSGYAVMYLRDLLRECDPQMDIEATKYIPMSHDLLKSQQERTIKILQEKLGFLSREMVEKFIDDLRKKGVTIVKV